MPYLPIDLDGRRKCEKAAAVLGVHPGEVSWALQELWEHAWREHFAGKENADMLSELILLGCLGTLGAKPRAAEVLVAYEFLECDGDLYRVRGAAKWLWGADGQTRAGKARAAGAKRDESGRLLPKSQPETQPEASRAGPGKSSQTPALSPSIQHPASNTIKEAAGRPKTGGSAFFAKVQEARHTHGLVSERLPRIEKLDRWYAEALMELNGDETRLWGAYEHFADDDYWKGQSPPWPFGGFMSQWRDHVPRAKPTAA